MAAFSPGFQGRCPALSLTPTYSPELDRADQTGPDCRQSDAYPACRRVASKTHITDLCSGIDTPIDNSAGLLGQRLISDFPLPWNREVPGS
ncbi:hypothetical protein STEG23_033383 [Scotinomys teguina]